MLTELSFPTTRLRNVWCGCRLKDEESETQRGKELAPGTPASKWVNGKWNSGLLHSKPTFTNPYPTGRVLGRAVVSVLCVREWKRQKASAIWKPAVCQASRRHTPTGTFDAVSRS